MITMRGIRLKGLTCTAIKAEIDATKFCSPLHSGKQVLHAHCCQCWDMHAQACSMDAVMLHVELFDPACMLGHHKQELIKCIKAFLGKQIDLALQCSTLLDQSHCLTNNATAT
jgi:hypothetical protein